MLNKCQMVYHHDNCLNTKKAYARPCRLCIDVCPHGAISEYREIDSSRCTECGICMAVCPSDGFIDRTIDKLFDYLAKKDKIVLNCPQAVPVGFEIPCLGIFDRDLWASLILYARSKSVEIHTGVCARCEDKKACALSVKTFKELHEEWPDHPLISIQVNPDNGDTAPQARPGEEVSRREVITGWRQRSREKLESMLPGLTAEEKYLIPRSRQHLVEELKSNPTEKIPFRVLLISDSCTSCGVCAAICPQGALHKREEGEKFSLIYEPFKCVQCRRCVEICRPQALSFAVKFLSYRLITGKILLHEGSPRYCARCGKQVFDNSEPPLCIACASGDLENRGFFF